MKNQKRIIQHLIQQSRATMMRYQQRQSENIIQQENFKPTIQFDTISNATQKYPENQLYQDQQQYQHSGNQYQIRNQDKQTEQDLQFKFQVLIDIGDGRSECIIITNHSDMHYQAVHFCQKYNLQAYIVNLLADSLTQQAKKQIQQLKKLSQNNRQKNIKTKNIMTTNNEEHKGLYKYNKNSQQLWRQPMHNINNGHPKINQISQQICRKLGKDKIIQSVSKKFYNKAKQLVQDQNCQHQRQFQSYSFHPYINPISRKVDQTLNYSRSNSRQNLNRYEHLYEQHKHIENKKQIRRRNSVLQIPFKPQINQVSRTIMAKKRSLGDIYSASTAKSSFNCITSKQQSQMKQKKRLNKSLNASSSNLCLHLYQQAKKRSQKIKKQTEKIYGTSQNNWKIIQNSNSLIHNLRQNRIRQVFNNLTKEPHKILRYEDINEKKLTDVQKIFMPVFKQMRQIDTQLTEQEFVNAGMRLIKYLSPNQRAILIRKNSHIIQQNKQNSQKIAKINKKSQQLVKQKGYGEKDIYLRGMIYKNQVKNHIQKGKQQKVRKQLRSCTFKPKINGLPNNIGY